LHSIGYKSGGPPVGQMDTKVAIVTGAGTGLGAATARAFAAEGADVVLVGRRAAKLEETAASMDGLPGRALVLPGDVSEDSTAEAALAAATRTFGGVDVLVNNAGIHAHPLLVHETPVAEFDDFLRIDLRGPFLFTRRCIPSMLERGGGAIVNISSMVALVGFRYSSAYAAAKGGLIALTRSTAADYGYAGIRANCVCPGGMEPVERGNLVPADYERLTEAANDAGGNLIDRMSHVDEVAQMVLFLSGPRSLSLTGAVIPFDSGFTAH
jgi:NAD(P)-dependent dehydrogenase (short-subunit alcohol dehydrogenase family)